MPSPDVVIHPNVLPRVVSLAGLRLREDVVYANYKGQEKVALRERAEKALERLQEVLGRLLEPEEAVLYVIRAQAPLNTFEQLTLGWHAYSMTGTVLVFTNRRLLRFRVKSKRWRDWAWNRGLQSVRWGDVAEVKIKGWLTRYLQLRYRSGKKETYLRVRRGDAKKLKILLAAVLPGASGEATSAQAMVPLCPDCLTTLTARVYQCGACGLTFKDEKTLLRRGLLIPGGGYYYAGWTTLGVLNGIFEAFLLLWIAFWILAAFGVLPAPEAKPDQPPTTRADALSITGILVLMVAIEKGIAFLHSRRFIREFIPTR